MAELKTYILETLGTDVHLQPIPKNQLGGLPIYITQAYKLYTGTLLNQPLLFINPFNTDDFSTLQLEKHFQILQKTFHKKLVLVLPAIPAHNRRRLIDKGINFIVPGKQLFLPELLLELREEQTPYKKAKAKKEKLLPSAQLLVLYHILYQKQKDALADYPFKMLANKLGYTAMAITKVVENLKQLELIDVKGEKEKFIHFRFDRSELWNYIKQQNLWVDPVLKRVFVDKKLKEAILFSNTSALPEYTNMNPGNQPYYAIDKNIFYILEKANDLVHPNEHEGPYCLEVWKYNPLTLVQNLHTDRLVVDPLSLYISLKEVHDERIEMALEQIEEKYIW